MFAEKDVVDSLSKLLTHFLTSFRVTLYFAYGTDFRYYTNTVLGKKSKINSLGL